MQGWPSIARATTSSPPSEYCEAFHRKGYGGSSGSMGLSSEPVELGEPPAPADTVAAVLYT